jgi:KipI family sensor histidine kinase inhibitor
VAERAYGYKLSVPLHLLLPTLRRHRPTLMHNASRGLHPEIRQPSGHSPKWRWVSERGLLVATGEASIARYNALASESFPEIEDIILADGSLLLVLQRGKAASAELLAALVSPLADTLAAAGKQHEIAVEYGGCAGPDLPALAEQAGLDEVAYINSHAAVEYTVAFLGFQPGFPYLRGLPHTLHAPRRMTPRLRVEAGSVAIGGTYTGVYPASGPGGWQIIGRTTATLFDPQRDAPALLMPGDRVRFVPQ